MLVTRGPDNAEVRQACGAIRRDKEHSTIIYESSEPNTPLLRLGWNKQDPRYMATILMDSSKARGRACGDACLATPS